MIKRYKAIITTNRFKHGVVQADAQPMCKSKDVSELENNQLPPLKIYCPALGCCHGNILKDVSQNEINAEWGTCHNCHGLGEVWNYLTPEQYISWMIEHGHPNYVMLDSDPVWHGIRFNNHIDWKINTYQKAYCSSFDIIIVARLGQPAPPKDYKHKEPKQ